MSLRSPGDRLIVTYRIITPNGSACHRSPSLDEAILATLQSGVDINDITLELIDVEWAHDVVKRDVLRLVRRQK